MTTTRERFGFVTGLLIALIAASWLFASAPTPVDGPSELARAGIPVGDADTRPAGDAEEEREEQAESVEHRVEAWQAAKREGVAGQKKPTKYVAGPTAAAATGWVGEFPIDVAADDWEPAIAADPNAPFVYVLTTRYAADKPCPGNCPTPWISLTISADGGATWAAAKPLCACKGSGQFDPIIEVVPTTGHVYALYMNGFNIMFTKSTNHGATWSTPVKTYGNVSWNDKPVLAVSDDGRFVYTSFNGPTGGDPWVARSSDSGATWSQVKLVDSSRYYFAFDADVASDGTVYFAESSLLYGGGGNKGTTPTGTVDEHLFISRDNGATWVNKVVAQTLPGVACTAAGCTPDFYLGHTAVSADASGRLVYLFDGATTRGGLQSIWATRSADRGSTWSAPVAISSAGEEATSPMMESRGDGDVRVAYAQTANGGNVDAWNTWYRRSTDRGATWSAPIRLSDATTGAVYKSAAGFAEIYGDYGEMAITSTGKTVAAWGEGASWDGPGGTWINRQS